MRRDFGMTRYCGLGAAVLPVQQLPIQRLVMAANDTYTGRPREMCRCSRKAKGLLATSIPPCRAAIHGATRIAGCSAWRAVARTPSLLMEKGGHMIDPSDMELCRCDMPCLYSAASTWHQSVCNAHWRISALAKRKS